MRTQTARLILAASAIAVALAAVAAALAIAGRSRADDGLIFPPHTTVAYHAGEFDFVASTNALGFRGGEFPLDRRSGIARIIAIGDSMTYGWGVDAACAWPALLETNLRRSGMSVEVANLGQPGASPAAYAGHAIEAVPRLRPDLVVVGITLADDLGQLDDPIASPMIPPAQRATSLPARLAGRLLRPFRSFVVTDVSATWRDQAHALIGALDARQRAVYQRLDAGVREMYEAGKLNPFLLQVSIGRPDYLTRDRNLSDPRTAGLIKRMAGYLEQIRDAAVRGGARVLVVAVPAGAFVSRAAFDGAARVGFIVDDAMLHDDAADDAVRTAARIGGVPFASITRAMRQVDSGSLYFPLDGHLTCDGTRRFADLIAPEVAHALTER